MTPVLSSRPEVGLLPLRASTSEHHCILVPDSASFYRRMLPHWQPSEAPLFITWRLHGSLPSHLCLGLPANAPGRAFLVLDRQLDSARLGPLWLKDPRLARLVADSLRFGESELGL